MIAGLAAGSAVVREEVFWAGSRALLPVGLFDEALTVSETTRRSD